jgi:pimeloyl-ACP methyl ester carboxylesterase
MTSKNSNPRSTTIRRSSGTGPVSATERTGHSSPATVSGRWLLIAVSAAILAAAACAWLTLCLLFWQGSWQLLYHPDAQVKRSPSDVGLAYDSVAFAPTDAGESKLKGWWISAAPDAQYGQYTALYLHGEKGNLGDAVDDVAALHAVGLNVLAFDYRGYGQSQFAHPSEAHWREDAEWALGYLTATRHVAANAIIVDGRGLGANLALELAAAHPELAGLVADSPLERPLSAVFGDPRARLVPARLLVRDRYDAEQAADKLIIPTLWFAWTPSPGQPGIIEKPDAYEKVHAKKTIVWLTSTHNRNKDVADALLRWLDDAPNIAPFSGH